jgi:hypothetical protein
MSIIYRRKKDGAVMRWSGKNWRLLLDNKCPNLGCGGDLYDSPDANIVKCTRCRFYITNDKFDEIVANLLNVHEDEEK